MGVASGSYGTAPVRKLIPPPARLLPDFPYVIIDERSMDIQFTTQIFKEGRMYVAYTPQLDVSSCGGTADKALRNLKEAVRLFLEEAEKLGTVQQILEEAGYLVRNHKAEGPKFVSTQRVSLSVPLADVKA
jgi:predicted RNase H-like HicB family nuclease